MPEMELRDLLMIYPFTKPTGIFDRKRARLAREMEQKSPYTTNEGVIALQKFSLTVEHGEFLVLLGPSGCGKTTLLRLIAGLETPVQGQILMDGKFVNELPRSSGTSPWFSRIFPCIPIWMSMKTWPLP